MESNFINYSLLMLALNKLITRLIIDIENTNIFRVLLAFRQDQNITCNPSYVHFCTVRG